MKFILTLFLLVLTMGAQAQTPGPPGQPYIVTEEQHEGQFRHINILAFTRGMDFVIPAGSERDRTEEWLSHRLDINEKDLGMAAYDEDIRFFRYDLDLTVFKATSNEIPDWEEAYLHFSEPTELAHRDRAGNYTGTVVQFEAGDRVELYMWTDVRYVYNPLNTPWRHWQASRLLSRLGEYDGVFLDEHSPGYNRALYMNQNHVNYGGGIQEFGGLRSTAPNLSGKQYTELGKQYSAAVVEYSHILKQTFDAEDKFILTNPAAYYWYDIAEDEYIASGGVTLEFVHRPFNWSANGYGNFIDKMKRAIDNGVLVDLNGSSCEDGPDGYGRARYNLWLLASYYQLRGTVNAPGRIYLNPEFCGSNASLEDFQAEWSLAYEYDIGDPVGESYVLQTGQAGCTRSFKIYAREYTNGLALVRPQDNYDCNDFFTSGVEIFLDEPMLVLNNDGSLSGPVNSVIVRNSEGFVLVKE